MYSGRLNDNVKFNFFDGQATMTVRIPANGWNTLRIEFTDGIGDEDNVISLQCVGKPLLIEHINNVEVMQTETACHVASGNYDPYIKFSVQRQEGNISESGEM